MTMVQTMKLWKNAIFDAPIQDRQYAVESQPNDIPANNNDHNHDHNANQSHTPPTTASQPAPRILHSSFPKFILKYVDVFDLYHKLMNSMNFNFLFPNFVCSSYSLLLTDAHMNKLLLLVCFV